VYDQSMADRFLAGLTGAARADAPHREWPYRRTAVMRYGVATIVVFAAFMMRYLIYGDLNNRLAFTFFVPAAMVAAWYGGVGPGLFATLMGVVLGAYFFLPDMALWPPGVRELMGLGVYCGTTVLCIVLCENLHQSIRNLEHLLIQVRHGYAAVQELAAQSRGRADEVVAALRLPRWQWHSCSDTGCSARTTIACRSYCSCPPR